MLFPHWSHAVHDETIRMTPEITEHELREFWRECARPVTLFDQPSPSTERL
jgi:hypothetical protein